MVFGRKAAALGEGFAAADAGPKTTIGKTVMRVNPAEMLGQVALGDMTDEAEVRRDGMERVMNVVRREVAAVPGAAEERRELAGLTAELMEHGGELFRKDEAAAGDGLWITRSVEDAFDRGTADGDAVPGPA